MRRTLPVLLGAAVAIGALIWGVTVVMSYLDEQSAQAVFADLAAAARAEGYEVAFGAVSMSNDFAVAEDVVIADPTPAAGWRWQAPQVAVIAAGDDSVELAVAGAQQFSYPVAGQQRSVPIDAQRARIDLRRAASGQVDRVVIEMSDFSSTPIAAQRVLFSVDFDVDGRAAEVSLELSKVTVGGADKPATAEHVTIRLDRAAGPGAVPAGSTAAIEAGPIVVPGYTDSPLGSTMARFNASIELRGDLAGLDLGAELAQWGRGGALVVTDSRIDWGVLSIDTAGVVQLGPGQMLEGELDARVRSFIPVLDAYHAFGRLDGALRADYYAALLVDEGERGEKTADFQLSLDHGEVAVARDADGLGRFVLGSLPPILGGMAAAE